MNFQLRPQIYSLLLCSSFQENPETGGWIVQPFSEIGVPEMPVDLALTIFAQIMAPPGTYRLDLRLFHAADPVGTARMLPPRTLNIQEGKNLDLALHVEAHITQVGLHIIEATLDGQHTAITPLRIATA
jgi:hypothetical protein